MFSGSTLVFELIYYYCNAKNVINVLISWPVSVILVRLRRAPKFAVQIGLSMKIYCVVRELATLD